MGPFYSFKTVNLAPAPADVFSVFLSRISGEGDTEATVSNCDTSWSSAGTAGDKQRSHAREGWTSEDKY